MRPEELFLLGRCSEAQRRQADPEDYLRRARAHGVEPVTVASRGYPSAGLDRLKSEIPPVLFCKGDLSLLQKPAVSLVGARALGPQGSAFAARVGTLAAQEGYVLVSGNANGADRTAQDACLAAGGSVISVLPDSLDRHTPGRRMLYITEEGWQLGFTSMRALRRNRIIHALGLASFAAQSNLGSGGTWDGSVNALRIGLTVYMHDDGSPAAAALAERGARLISLERLISLRALL